MDIILTLLRRYHIKFDKASDTTLRVYSHLFQGYSVIRKADDANFIEKDGRLQTIQEFEAWLFTLA